MASVGGEDTSSKQAKADGDATCKASMVGIKVTYPIASDGNEEGKTLEQSFDGDSVEPARIGLPAGQEPIKVRLFVCLLVCLLAWQHFSAVFPEKAGFSLTHLRLPSHAVFVLQPQAGSFAYSGMHDQGPLPPPREGGAMATLIACVQEAKNFNDEFLTKIIEEEKSQATSHVTAEDQAAKKQKI